MKIPNKRRFRAFYVRRLLNEGQQLAGAAVLAENDGLTAFDVVSLKTGKYITADFAGWTEANGVYTFETTSGVCSKLNEKTLGTATPSAAQIAASKISCSPDAAAPTKGVVSYAK